MVFIIINRVIIIHDEVHDIDRELTLNIVSEVKHRSHRFFRKCKEPDNWILVDATDKFGFEYECWYFIEDMDNFNLDNIDYNNPKDVITKKGRLYIR